MKLLDVKAVLVRERDIQKTDPNREILKELDDKDTRYAILSHRWGAEVNYEEMTGLMKMRKEERKEVRERYGYQKIIKSCEQAMKDGYEWLWIDTCCIDKRSSTELSEAINSMYRWYRNAQVCYAYLNDVDEEVFPVERNYSKFKSNGCPEWFVRGWTLQELIAPKQLEFFNMAWVSIGNKRRLALALKDITKIPPEVVRDGLAAKRPCIAQIMSWAADRKTTRVEDRAYSLMGLFGVNMPMLYGEGEKAFQRLQLEIIRTSSDHSVFAWGSQNPRTGSVLADDPSDFRGCGDMKSLEHKEFVDRLARYISSNERANAWFSSRKGLGQYKFLPSPIYVWRGERLGRRARSLSQPLRTFSVSNAGIQMFLPVIPYPNSPSHLRALLACRLPNEPLATIDLVFSGSSFERTLSTTDGPTALPEFKTLYLTYNQDANETRREFTLDDEHASYHGFTRRGTFPRKFPGDTVTLSSLTDDLIVIVYANDDVKSRFAVGLGYYLHQGWVHVVCDDQEADWTAFAKNAHARMWKARAKHAQSMPKRLDDPNPNHEDHFIKHAHLPRSIWGARVVWGDWEMDNFKVMVDVEQCPGCCDGPCTWTTARKSWRGLDTPGLMLMNHQPYECRLDGWPAQLDECSGQRIALGDYGDYSDGNFKCTGNIFEDTRTPGVDPVSSDCAVVSRVAGNEQKRDGPVVIPRGRISYLALHQPKGLSLPTNKCIMLLLKTLSTRAAGKHLVITVIQCSDFYRADSHGKRMDPRDDSGNHLTEPRILTSLYTIASPQVWQRKPPFAQRRERFQSIREHFYALVNMDQFRGPEARHKPVDRQKTDRAIKIFSDMFGLRHLSNYVGEITFFERLPRMMATNTRGEVSVGNVEAALDLRLASVLLFLAELCRAPFVTRLSPDEQQKVARELESISQTLSVGLLKPIGDTFMYGHLVRARSGTGPSSGIEYDRHFNTPSMVQEVEVLQAKLSTTEDEDEQRALEEDVTGKILWLCWCGIRAELDELLPKIVDFIRGIGKSLALQYIGGDISSFTGSDPGDDHAHLQRIMFDAGAGTSKHQLLLAARAAEQAKWSDTTISKDITNTNTQGPSTSSQSPSTSVV